MNPTASLRLPLFSVLALLATALLGFAPMSSAQTVEVPPASPSKMPHFTVYKMWGNPPALVGGVLVIAPADATEAKLTALCLELSRANEAASSVTFQVLTDVKAAQIRDKPSREQTKADLDYFEVHYVAHYVKNTTTNYHEIEVMPRGSKGPIKTISLAGQ